jgi:uncharacterized protein (TIGR02246 family)
MEDDHIMATEHRQANDEAAIRELLARFARAFHDKDVRGVMAPFATDIVSFDIVPPLQTIGADTFVTHWQQFFALYEGPIHVEFPDVRIAVGGDVAFSHCVHRITGTLKTGQQSDRWLRWTACYRKTNDRWLIVHEHVSVPVDLESGKALMDLEPDPRLAPES